MDKLLKGIIDSSHPDGLKQLLIEKTILQSASAGTSPEYCPNILRLSAEMVSTSEKAFVQTMGLKVFVAWASENESCLLDYLTEQTLTNLLLSDAYPNRVHILNLIAESFRILSKNQGSGQQLRLNIAKKLESLGFRVSNHAITIVSRVASMSELCALCTVMLVCPACIPSKPSARTFLAISIARILASVEVPREQTEAVSVFTETTVISHLFRALTDPLDKSNLLNILKAVYVLVSTVDSEPSIALASVVQYLPLSLSPEVVTVVMTDASVSDEILCLSLRRMMDWLAWPANVTAIARWILTLLKGLALVAKFSVLIELTQNKIDQIVDMLDYPGARRGAMAILGHMLLSYQHSSDVFHKIITRVSQKIATWTMVGDNGGKDESLLELVRLIHTMIHLHTGFPDLYDPVLSILEPYPKPNVQLMNSLLQANKWSTALPTYNTTLHSICIPRSDTGKTGLVNLGNTCYMNSVIQTLYMTDEFRNSVLQSPLHPQQGILRKLQRMFGFLTHTQRAAFSASDFYEASRPPWFETGNQQDCSEYLRHLLDILHEQELSAQTSMRAPSPSPSVTSVSMTKNCPVARSRATKRKNSGHENPIVNSHESCSEPVENGVHDAKSLVHHTFAGKLLTSYKCFSCGHISETAENFIDLHLAFPSHSRDGRAMRYHRREASRQAVPRTPTTSGDEAMITDDATVQHVKENGSNVNPSSPGAVCLDDLLDYYLCPELLEGENKYFCSNCNKLSDAERSIRIVESPRHLILTLLRFSYDLGTRSRSKILTDVQYPLVLYLPAGETPVDRNASTAENSSGMKSDRNGDLAPRDRFVLYAVVIHSGVSSESGHYYSCARHSTKMSLSSKTAEEDDESTQHWCMFNDSHVSFCSYKSFGTVTKRFPKDTAYVLLYRKCGPGLKDGFGSEMDAKAVPLMKEIRDAIENDNIHFLQEKELEAKLSRQCRGISKPTYNWRDFDDSNPPGSCGSGGGGFSSLVSGNVARFVC